MKPSERIWELAHEREQLNGDTRPYTTVEIDDVLRFLDEVAEQDEQLMRRVHDKIKAQQGK